MRFSILTAGNIAEKMAATVCKMPEISCRSIASRELSKAQALADKYGFETAFGSYDELYNDDTDIIYIGSPHSHHYEHAKAALIHKKHVLCEKPAAVNAKQLKELYEIAKQNGVVFCDAVWTRFMPFANALSDIIKSGKIGDAYMLDCSMGFCSSDIPRMASPKTAGGALLDLGIYPLSIALIAFGETSATIDGVCTKTSLGVDAQNIFTLRFSGGQLACLKTSMVTLLDNTAIIYGTKGKIVIENDFWKCEEFIVYGESGKEVFTFPHEISGYEYEVRSLVYAIKSGLSECLELPLSESVRALEYLDALREGWGIKFPCEQ